MKKIVFGLGFSSAFIFGVGYIFKNMHWPTANIQIMIGAGVFTFVFLPLYFMLKYRGDRELNRPKPAVNYVLNMLLVMVLALAIPYKQFKWTGSDEFFLVAQLLLAFVFFPKVFLGWYRKFSEPQSAAA